jgi:hypothetical protein
VREVVDPEPRRLRLMNGGREFLLDVRIDALAMELFGEGTLACVVQPRFPHCPKGSFEHGPLKYDNTPYVLAETSTPFDMGGLQLAIGERIEVSVELRGCFRGFHARLDVFETDVHEVMTPSSLGVSRRFEWLDGDVTPVPWRIGCTDPAETAPVFFDYQDPGEEGPDLELDYELWLGDPADALSVGVSAPGQEWWWKRVPDPPQLQRGQARQRPPAAEEKHGKVEVKLRFLELAPVRAELEQDAITDWQFSPKVPLPGLKKRNVAGWPWFTDFARPEEFGPIDKWVYAFAHDRQTNEIKLVDERFCGLQKTRRPQGGHDDGKVHPRPVKEANRQPATRTKLARPLENYDEQYFTYEYDSDKVDLYFCLSRIQLPHWRLRDYETDGKAQPHTDLALRRLRNRCLRHAPWDASYQLRYLDVKGGADVVQEPELDDVQVLALPDVMQIVEDAQKEYLTDAQKVQNLSGSEDWDETDSLEAQRRFLAGLVGHVVDKYSETDEGRRRLGQFFKEAEFRQWVQDYDAKLARAQKRVELWQQYKLSWIEDAQAAADDDRFLGKGLYAETREDYLLSRRRGGEEPRGAPDPASADEVKIYAANEDAFFAHWAKVSEHTSASGVGKHWLVRMLHESGSFVRDILLDPAVTFASGRERIGEVEHVTDVLEQHVLVPAAKFGRYERLQDPASSPREIITSAGDELSGGLKAMKQGVDILATLSVTEQALAKSLKGLATFDLRRVTVYRSKEASELVFHVRIEEAGKVRWQELQAPLDFRVNESDAKLMLRALGGDEKMITVKNVDGLRPPGSMTDDAKLAVDGKSITKSIGRVMLLLNGINFVLAIPKAFETLAGDGGVDVKVRAAMELSEAAADFVASVEVLKYVSQLEAMGSRLAVVVRFAGIVAGILGVAIATWKAIEAFNKGNYGEGIAQVAIGVGTGAIMFGTLAVGAGLITAGAATWWTGVGIVLVLVGAILSFIYGQPEDTAIEKWLKQSPWGWSPSNAHPATQTRKLLEILIKPKCYVFIDPTDDPKTAVIQVDIYSLYFVEGKTQYFVEVLDARQSGKTFAFGPKAWFPEAKGVQVERAAIAPDKVFIARKAWPEEKDKFDPDNEVTVVAAQWRTGLLQGAVDTDFTVKLQVRYHPEWRPSEERYTYKRSDEDDGKP